MRWSQRRASNPRTPAALSRVPDPTTIKVWLADSANDDPAAGIDRLTELLSSIESSPMPLELRFDSIDTCRRYAQRLRRSLNPGLIGLSLPLPNDQQQTARKFAKAFRLLAHCYKALVDRSSEAGHTVQPDSAYFYKSCYWGIACLGEHLLINYECYFKSPREVWLDAHKLYDIAQAEGVELTPLHDDARAAQNVQHVYKRVLLLGLSNPFHQPFRGLARVYERLDDWARLATFATSTENPGRCLFTIDPRLDRPAVPALSRSRIRPEFNEKWLNTRRLVDKLKRQHDFSVKRAARRLDQSKEVNDELDSMELLRQLIVHWGLHPVRNATRTSTYKRRSVVIGLKSICTALNAFRPFVQRSIPRGAEWISRMKPATVSGDPANPMASNEWEIVDESEHGFKILFSSSDASRKVSVGELVAVSTGRPGEWTLGSVHWAQIDERNELSLGIRRIKMAAEPVLIGKLHSDPTVDHTPHTALLLTDNAGGRGGSLICDKSFYQPNGTYLVRSADGTGERVLESCRMLKATRAFVWFEVRKPQASTRQKSLDLIYPY